MRKTIIVKASFGRDEGKHFFIREWSAERAEKWAMRAIIAYNRGGGQIPIDAIEGGMEAIFWLGINTFLRGNMKAEEVIPVLDELLEDVQMVRDPKTRAPDGGPILTPISSPDDIEEVKTRLWLRSEVIKLHTGFSVAEVAQRLISAMMVPSTSPRSTSPA